MQLRGRFLDYAALEMTRAAMDCDQKTIPTTPNLIPADVSIAKAPQ
ncbi:MAG: hypothetical protein ISS70_24145 [Phycisphaerae bacterium]|nr:hypothetical protein [Phycisphaerae bacterium]